MQKALLNYIVLISLSNQGTGLVWLSGNKKHLKNVKKALKIRVNYHKQEISTTNLSEAKLVFSGSDKGFFNLRLTPRRLIFNNYSLKSR